MSHSLGAWASANPVPRQEVAHFATACESFRRATANLISQPLEDLK
jgi:hypothetical protein